MSDTLPIHKVYVLELEGTTKEGSRRLYVGSTKNVEKRYEKHLSGEGSEYTRQFKPQYILEIYDGGDEKSTLKKETEITEKYILSHGIGVRGAHYLHECDVISFLMKEKHLNNLCYSCGKNGHYSSSCPSRSNETVSIKVETESAEDKKARLSKIKVSLWSSGKSKYGDSSVVMDGKLHVSFGAQTHQNNKNDKVQCGALYCDTSKGGWTVRGLVTSVSFISEENVFKLVVSEIPESGLSIRSTTEQNGKVGIATSLGLPLPSYQWTSSGIVVHRT